MILGNHFLIKRNLFKVKFMIVISAVITGYNLLLWSVAQLIIKPTPPRKPSRYTTYKLLEKKNKIKFLFHFNKKNFSPSDADCVI